MHTSVLRRAWERTITLIPSCIRKKEFEWAMIPFFLIQKIPAARVNRMTKKD
jgi:hypothetical protein